MIKPKTYFKQVPLKVIKKIVEQAEQEHKTLLPAGTGKKKLKISLVEAIPVIR